MGRSVNDLEHRARRKAGPVLMQVEGIGRGQAVQDVSLELRAGEVFGIAGLVGSGRTELVRLLFGADRADRGSIALAPLDTEAHQAAALEIPGQQATKTVAHSQFKTWLRGFASPLQAIAAGVGLVTEDRKSQGLLLGQPIRINATLSDLPAVSRGGWLRNVREHELVQGFIRTLRIRCTSGEQPVGELSGGNQQKVVFARWLHRPVQVLLLDEPTRGVDVGARAEIYAELDRMASEGRALLMVSSDLRELMAMADRIGVMSAGRLVAVFERGQWSEQALLAAAFSESAGRPATADAAAPQAAAAASAA